MKKRTYATVSSWLNVLGDRPGLVWLIAFVYTIAAGLLIQLILLPHVFPALHWGSGLFKGMDAPHFHELALELSDRSYVLEQGRVALSGTGAELLGNPHVKSAYLGA